MFAIYNFVKTSNRTTHRCQSIRRGQSALARQGKVSDEGSEDSSPDEARPLPNIKPVKEGNRPLSTNRPNGTLAPPKKERRISSIINNMRKTSSVKEMADFIIYPDGALSYYWMSLVTLSVMYNFASIILRLAFGEMRDQKIFYMLDNVTDAIYIFDILVQSRTAFLEDGCLVLEAKAIFQHYRQKLRFWFDMISIFPSVTIHWFLCVFINLVTLNISTLFEVTPVPSLRFLRLLKYHQVATFFEQADSRTRRPSLLRAFKLSLHLFMVIHWIACIYYMVSEFEGLGSNEWVYTKEISGGFRRKYIRSLYWSMMTLTTIGERPSPETDLEYIFTGATFLIGVFVFAAVVGNVGDVISNMNAARHDFQSRMDQIKFYMNHRAVPEDLQDRVKKWAEYSWTRTQAMDEPSVLAMLPDRLRTEIAIHVHLDTLKQVKIFEECEEGLLRELVLKLRPQIYSPGDYICRTGEIGREMYIINHGRIEILVPKGNTFTRVALLKPGNYFGEISLLKLDDGQNRRTADVRAIGYSELLCLSRKDLISALGEYPEAKKILEAQAMQRMKETKGVLQNDGATSTNVQKQEPPKRKASDVFSQVMRQEGFRKLLSSRDHEMSELRKLVAEMRDISKKQKDPEKDTLEEKYKALEQRFVNKDTALKQAKRRINQLETYVRIRAYNAKYQKCNVPQSDPKDYIVQKHNDHVNLIQSHSAQESERTRKISNNLELLNGSTQNKVDTHIKQHYRTRSLDRVSTLPEKRNGCHYHLKNSLDTKSLDQSDVQNRTSLNRSNSELENKESVILRNDPPEPVRVKNGDMPKDFCQVEHNNVSDLNLNIVDGRITNEIQVSRATIMLHPKSRNTSETQSQSEDSVTQKTPKCVTNMKYSGFPLVQGNNSNSADKVVLEKDISPPTVNPERHDIKEQCDSVNSQNSEAKECDIQMAKPRLNNDKTRFKLLHRNSEDTNDSGISEKDCVFEDEEIARLLELFTKNNSTDSYNSSLSHSDSNTDFSSADELDL